MKCTRDIADIRREFSGFNNRRNSQNHSGHVSKRAFTKYDRTSRVFRLRNNGRHYIVTLDSIQKLASYRIVVMCHVI